MNNYKSTQKNVSHSTFERNGVNGGLDKSIGESLLLANLHQHFYVFSGNRFSHPELGQIHSDREEHERKLQIHSPDDIFLHLDNFGLHRQYYLADLCRSSQRLCNAIGGLHTGNIQSADRN